MGQIKINGGAAPHILWKKIIWPEDGRQQVRPVQVEQSKRSEEDGMPARDPAHQAAQNLVANASTGTPVRDIISPPQKIVIGLTGTAQRKECCVNI